MHLEVVSDRMRSVSEVGGGGGGGGGGGMALEAVEPVLTRTGTRARCIEVVRDGPGACPICGMALEPRGDCGGSGESRTGEHAAEVLDRGCADSSCRV